jgi:hypothetical protein
VGAVAVEIGFRLRRALQISNLQDRRRLGLWSHFRQLCFEFLAVRDEKLDHVSALRRAGLNLDASGQCAERGPVASGRVYEGNNISFFDQ